VPRCGVRMSAPRGRGGSRGGGLAGGFELLSQGSVEVQGEDGQSIRDKEHAEKRKREGRQGGAEGSSSRRDSRFTTSRRTIFASIGKRSIRQRRL
jgi:hypothetical protein